MTNSENQIIELQKMIKDLSQENKRINRLLYVMSLHTLNNDKSKFARVLQDIDLNKNDIDKLIKQYSLITNITKKYPKIDVNIKPLQNIIECKGQCISSLEFLKKDLHLYNWIESIDDVDLDLCTLTITVKDNIL